MGWLAYKAWRHFHPASKGLDSKKRWCNHQTQLLGLYELLHQYASCQIQGLQFLDRQILDRQILDQQMQDQQMQDRQIQDQQMQDLRIQDRQIQTLGQEQDQDLD